MKIFISPKALLKMQALVMGYNKEVGWWGTVEKIKAEEYRIKDILVFPQYTGAAYIDDEAEDPLEMAKWLDGLSDEVFDEKRFFGHSHVNMNTYFSGEDAKMFDRQVDVIKRAPLNNYYLSVVLNKRGEMCWKAWDGETNKKYSDHEIEILFEVEEGLTNIDFFEKSKEMVRDLKKKSSNSLIFGGGYKEYTYETYKYPSYKNTTQTQIQDASVPRTYYSKLVTVEDDPLEEIEDFEKLYIYVEPSTSGDIEVSFCEKTDFYNPTSTKDLNEIKEFTIFGSDTGLVMDNSKAKKLGADTLYSTLFELTDGEGRMIVLSTEKDDAIDVDCLTEQSLYRLFHRNCVVEDEQFDYILIIVEGEECNEYK